MYICSTIVLMFFCFFCFEFRPLYSRKLCKLCVNFMVTLFQMKKTEKKTSNMEDKP